MNSTEKLYKLYNIKDKREYEGSIEKCECSINGEYGLFKERMSMQSIDNVMEEVVYEIANLIGVNCSYARCRKHNNIIGSFSRYEIPYAYEFEHLSTIVRMQVSKAPGGFKGKCDRAGVNYNRACYMLSKYAYSLDGLSRDDAENQVIALLLAENNCQQKN